MTPVYDNEGNVKIWTNRSSTGVARQSKEPMEIGTPVKWAYGGIVRGPQSAIIGEAGDEAVIPLEGKNRKFGLDLLKQIIPKYFPDLFFMQQGGVVSTGPGGGTSLQVGEDTTSSSILTNLIKFKDNTYNQFEQLLGEFSLDQEDLEINSDAVSYTHLTLPTN